LSLVIFYTDFPADPFLVSQAQIHVFLPVWGRIKQMSGTGAQQLLSVSCLLSKQKPMPLLFENLWAHSQRGLQEMRSVPCMSRIEIFP